jgi:hypothetical protein
MDCSGTSLQLPPPWTAAAASMDCSGRLCIQPSLSRVSRPSATGATCSQNGLGQLGGELRLGRLGEQFRLGWLGGARRFGVAEARFVRESDRTETTRRTWGARRSTERPDAARGALHCAGAGGRRATWRGAGEAVEGATSQRLPRIWLGRPTTCARLVAGRADAGV